MPAWGKYDDKTRTQHHLAHHGADVAAVFITLLTFPTFRNRAEQAARKSISDEEIECLGALAFLHDIGKIAPSFQVKNRPKPHPIMPRGHIKCGWKWTELNSIDALGGNASYLAAWPEIEKWLHLLFSHHGRPVPRPSESWGQDSFNNIEGYNWKAEETLIGNALINWFPSIREHQPPNPNPVFEHFIAGLLQLADWIGSDQDEFPYIKTFDTNYWHSATGKAQKCLVEIGLNTKTKRLASCANWSLVSNHSYPHPVQETISKIPLEDKLLILEAETGSGKTEAALWRFAILYEAGYVDGLYFAVPTRAAARQLQWRINQAMKRMFVAPHPEVVLAIPGQILMGESKGVHLPNFKVLWDDADEFENHKRPPSRWASENATRFLAAQIAVGTVDQMMMSGLQVKNAHLRGSALSRSLVVVDEVHASDTWMTHIIHNALGNHISTGGFALLMSATLGSTARKTWLNDTSATSFAEAQNDSYPVVWTNKNIFPVRQSSKSQKDVLINKVGEWSGEVAAQLAISAASKGARVLVIRNTVLRAQETFSLCCEQAPELVFDLKGVKTLHHSRFAAEDRYWLDKRVEEVFGKSSCISGVILVGTQTLEQSLDIDADLLITDLCPMDVLLQRIGRLHRHKKTRPQGFQQAVCNVLCPDQELSILTEKGENGLGNYAPGGNVSGVYINIPCIAATIDAIEKYPNWRIPEMNRYLVEYATHLENLDQFIERYGLEEFSYRLVGKTIAEEMGAKTVMLDWEKEFPMQFLKDEAIRTRLGLKKVIVDFPNNTQGPFQEEIHTISLPQYYLQESDDIDSEIELLSTRSSPDKRYFEFKLGKNCFRYSSLGLEKMDN